MSLWFMSTNETVKPVEANIIFRLISILLHERKNKVFMDFGFCGEAYKVNVLYA